MEPNILPMSQWASMAAALPPPQSWYDEPDDDVLDLDAIASADWQPADAGE